MRISVELVPRDSASLLVDAAMLREHFPSVTQLNIPDLLRFPVRSWEACALTRSVFPLSIPHIRAIDMPPEGSLTAVEAMVAQGITEVTLEWNQAFARRALESLGSVGGHVYFMPIRIDIRRYLSGVLSPAAEPGFTADRG